MKRLFSFLLLLSLLTSCQNDISGRYKAINPSQGFIREEIYIDWKGEITGNKLFVRDVYGKSVEYYANHSWKNPQSVRCDFVYKISMVGALEKKGDKYVASNFMADVNIDKSQFSTKEIWGRQQKTDKELIEYYEKKYLDTIPKLDNVTFSFIIKEDKLIPVGGNEIDDYFIKLVD